MTDVILTCSSWEDEDENILLLVELINQELSFLDRSLSIKAEIPCNINYHISFCNSNSGLPVISYFQIFLHDIHHHGELGEYQHPVPITLHAGKEIIEDLKLARVTDLMIPETQMFDALKQKKHYLSSVLRAGLSYPVGLTGFINFEVWHDLQILHNVALDGLFVPRVPGLQ